MEHGLPHSSTAQSAESLGDPRLDSQPLVRDICLEAAFADRGSIMASGFILSDYLRVAMAAGEYDKLEDVSFAGRIAVCPGVLAFGSTLPSCEDELRSTLEDWLLVGLKLGHPLPVLDGIDLNEEPRLEPLDAV